MNENNLQMDNLSLLEVLAKTTYQIQITRPHDKECDRPIAFGSGFIINYKSTSFFVTADHNIHLDDYAINERTGVDNVVSIFNNISNKNDFSTLITPLGGFYYMERFDITKPTEVAELIDVTVCILTKERHFIHPFLTDGVFRDGNPLVKPGERKFIFTEELLAEAKSDEMYFIFGKIKPEMKGLLLHREDTLKEQLKYVCQVGEYFLFNTPTVIESKEEWAGLSGSPVLSETGNCVGVLCSVNVGTISFFVKPIAKVKLLMDIAIQQEQIATL